jgi:hypothetical protein
MGMVAGFLFLANPILHQQHRMTETTIMKMEKK